MSSEQATDEAIKQAKRQVHAIFDELWCQAGENDFNDPLDRQAVISAPLIAVQLARIATALESLDVTLKAGTYNLDQPCFFP